MIQVELKKVKLSNGETLAYREREGGEEVVILVHGNMTSSVHWDVVFEQLAPKYKVFAVDLRGFGESSYHMEIASIQDFSDDLRMFVDKMGLRNFSLVGWSLGGTVCMQFCADHPGYCHRLFLLGSGSSRGYPFYPLGEDGLPDINNRLRTYEQVQEDDKTKFVQLAYDTLNFDFLRQMWDMTIYINNKPEERRYEKYLQTMAKQRNLAEVYQALNTFNLSPIHNGLVSGEDKINNIHIPVMIAWGEHDMVVTKQMTEELLSDFGGKAVYKELKNCGHSPQTDDIDQLVDVMESFL